MHSQTEEQPRPGQAGEEDPGGSAPQAAPVENPPGEEMPRPPSATAKGVFSVLQVSIISVYPVLFLYLRNAKEMDFSHISAEFFAFWLLGLAFLGLGFLLMRSAAKAALAASVAMLVFQNYMPLQGLVQRAFSGLGYLQVLPLVALVLVHLAYLLHRKLPRLGAFRVAQLVSIGFAAVLLVTAVTAAPALAAKVTAKAPEAESLAETPPAGAAGGPNIYYLIFDEYSRADMLEKYFGYDNSAFTAALEERGFEVSATSENESSSTSVVTANLMMLDYPAREEDTDRQLGLYRENGALHGLLNQRGYEMVGVGESDYFGIPSETYDAGQRQAATEAGRTGAQLVWQRTPLAPFMQQNAGEERGRQLLDARDYFENPASYTGQAPRFTLSYLAYPHQTFIFDAEGGYVDPVNWENWEDGQYYLNQLIYTSKIMLEMVDGIQANDPGAIIIIQSDHSARGLVIDAETEETVPMEDRRKILNAVYNPGGPEIEGLSGVNTLRAVLSEAWGMSLPALDVPQDEFLLGRQYRDRRPES